MPLARTVRTLSAIHLLAGAAVSVLAIWIWHDVATYDGESSTYAVGYAVALLCGVWGGMTLALSLPAVLSRRVGPVFAVTLGTWGLLSGLAWCWITGLETAYATVGAAVVVLSIATVGSSVALLSARH